MLRTLCALACCAIPVVGAAQIVAPYIETFDALPSGIVAPGLGTTVLGPSVDVVGSSPTGSRVRVADPIVDLAFGFSYSPPGGNGNGPKALILDKATGGGDDVVNQVVFHIDYAASSEGGGIVVRFLMREESDEPDLEDIVAIQDGLTSGAAVGANGSATAPSGYDGFLEVLLLDWNAEAIEDQWREFTLLIDDALLTAEFGTGAPATTDLRLIFRQADNFDFESNLDGLLIDHVRIEPLLEGPGAPPRPGQAVLDLNGAANAQGFGVGTAMNGPYFASVAPGGLLSFSIEGVPLQPILLMTGPLNPNVHTFFQGQMDIGVANPVGPFIPFALTVVANGVAPVTFFDSLFNTTATGLMTLTVTAGALTPGTIATFQAALLDGSPTIASLSNAVQLSVQ